MTRRVITEPAVWLLTTPQLFEHPDYVLPPDGSVPDRIIATAGKICYDSFGPDGNPVISHVQNLVKQVHFSVIEHVSVGLVITGVSRGFSHELVRHRHGSYSQRSTRYTKEDGGAIVLDAWMAWVYEQAGMAQFIDASWHSVKAIIPRVSSRCGVPEDQIQWVWDFIVNCLAQVDAYKPMVERLMAANPLQLDGKVLRKWARGKARQMLPHALETRVVMTMNLRSWREFVIKRTNEGAEEEMRRLASQVYYIMTTYFPNVFQDTVATLKGPAPHLMFPEVTGSY